jgi:hypothetical protein
MLCVYKAAVLDRRRSSVIVSQNVHRSVHVESAYDAHPN